jgi:hypothetical protein
MNGERIMRLILVLAAAFVILVGGSTAAYAKTACDLLTSIEASSLAGTPIGLGRPGGPGCTFAAIKGPNYVQTAMILTESASEALGSVDMMLTIAKSRQGQHPAPEMISGVGDRAILDYDNGGNATLSVAVHATFLQLVIRPGSVPMTSARKEAMIQAMKTMISRL